LQTRSGRSPTGDRIERFVTGGDNDRRLQKQGSRKNPDRLRIRSAIRS